MKKISISIQVKGIWYPLPCRKVVEDFEFKESYFNNIDLKPNHPKAQITLCLDAPYLDLIEGLESFPCLIEIDGYLSFGGYADYVFSSTEIFSADNSFKSLILNLTVRDWLSFFDFELEKAFNPFSFLKIVQPLYICNPLEKGKSILHLLFSYLEAPFLIDPNLVINQKSFSFVIKEEENVLKCLDTLFYNLGYYFFIEAGGTFKAYPIKTFSDNPENLQTITCLENFAIHKRFKKFSEIEVEFAQVTYFSREGLEFEQKKAIYSEAGSLDTNENPPKMDPLIMMLGETFYPEGTDETPLFITPQVDFLQSHYTMEYIKEGIFGAEGKENKDISIVALWRYDVKFQADDEIVLHDFQEKINEFALSFKNIIERPENPAELATTLRDLDYFDVFSDVLWRKNRILISEKKEENLEISTYLGTSRDLKVTVKDRPFRRKEEIFLEYINDKETASYFFNIQQSLIKYSDYAFSFSSLKDLKLNEFYKLRSVTGREFIVLINSKSRSLDTRKFTYEALNAFEIQNFDQNTTLEQGGSIKPPPVAIYSVSNEYDNLNTLIETDYINDETALIGLDNQAYYFNGQLSFTTSIFFSAGFTYTAPILFLNGACFRKPPLSHIYFTNALNEPFIENREGAFIKLSLKSKNILKNGTSQCRFKIS